jgi:hypothetical protein
MEKFWYLHSPESDAKQSEYAEGMDWEGIVCPVNSGHRRAGRRVTDLSVKLRGNGVDDFVWTFFSECLVQDRVLELFRTHGVTGYEVKPNPVKTAFKRKRGCDPPRLWELVVTGWAGMAPPESGVRLTSSCDACGDLEYSGCTNPANLIDPGRWDGSDLFMVWPLPRFIFVTDRLAQLIRDNRLTGAVLRRPEELTFHSAGFGPGRLSLWMPEARARELGEPRGIF